MRTSHLTPRSRWARFRFTGETVACDLCGSREAIVVGRYDRWLNPLRNVMCRGCGLVRLDPMPTEAETALYYRSVYRRHYHGEERPRAKATIRAKRWAEARVEALKGIAQPGARVLDIGAGSGEFVALARKAGFRCEGLEPNEAYAAFAREAYGVELHCGGWESAPYEAGSFDVLTMHHVLEHLRTPRAALEAFHLWLKPQGLLHIAVPNIADPDRTPLGRFHFGHKHNFTRETLEMLGLRTGYDCIANPSALATDLLFRRLEAPAPDWMRYPDHAADLERFFATHTIGRHLLRATPYRKFLRRVRRLFGETVEARTKGVSLTPAE